MALENKKIVNGLELHFRCRIFRSWQKIEFYFPTNYVLLKLLFKLVSIPTAAQKHPNGKEEPDCKLNVNNTHVDN